MKTIIIEKLSKYDEDFDVIKWVLKAKSEDKARINICGIKIDGGLIIATDGSRLHCCLTDRDLEDGTYDVKSNTNKQIILTETDNEYPDYERVFPKFESQHHVTCNGKDWPLFHAVYQYIANDEKSFDTAFLHDAYMDHCNMSLYSGKFITSPLVIYDNNKRAAIVMPIKNS